MLAAVVADLAALADIEVAVLRDGRLPALPVPDWPRCQVIGVHDAEHEQAEFKRLAAAADGTLLIAPETAGELLRRSQCVEQVGGRLLSPPSECVALASDKQATVDYLASRDIRVPAGCRLSESAPVHELQFPLVAKPLDGCGSQDVRLIQSAAELCRFPQDGTFRVERYVPGLAASVAVLCGPSGCFPLSACQQRLSRDGEFTYLGGRLPIARSLNQRAQSLAAAAVAALPAAHGYVGVDLVLGAAADGREDYVIEINPRLTTSYVGLRVAARTNLAAAMLAVCDGLWPALSFDDVQVEINADGTFSV